MSKKKLIGYVGTKDIALLTENDIRALDVINLAFAGVKNDSVVYNPESGFSDAVGRIRNVNASCRIMLSVGGWSAGGFSEAAATEKGRSLFAQSALQILEKYGLDGLDIDWEYPCIDAAGIAASPADKVNFTALIKTCYGVLNTAAENHRMLTIAAGAGAYFIDNTEMEKVHPYLDYVQLMTYDLRGAYRNRTGHHAALYDDPGDSEPNKSTQTAVLCFTKAGVPPEKLIVGAAYYSRMWKGVRQSADGLHAEAETKGDYGPGYGQLVKEYIGKNGYTRFFDEQASAPWLFNGDTFISYDDEQSCRAKAAYVNEKGLGGIMFWEYGLDDTYTLTRVLRTALDGSGL